MKILAIIAPLGFAAEGFGYQLKKTEDGSKVVTWAVRELEILIELPKALELPGLADAVRAGFEVWTATGLPMRLSFRVVDKPMPLDHADGVSVVRWEKSWSHPAEAAAMTLSSYRASTGFRNPGADIVLNLGKRWTTDPAGHPAALDVQSVIAHEAGHFFGLDHSQVEAATMYAVSFPGDVSKRRLADDDRRGLAALVQAMAGAADSPGMVEAISTSGEAAEVGCSAIPGAGGASSGPGLLGLGYLLLHRRLTRRSAASGQRAPGRRTGPAPVV